MLYTVLIDGEAGGYGVVFPDLPGCTAMGETVEKALTNAAAAARDWIEVTQARGGAAPLPRPAETLLLNDPDVHEALDEGARLAFVPVVIGVGRKKTANLSLDVGVLAAIDAAADRMGQTRSRVVELLAEGGGLARLG